jgi:hypothetical protein
MAFPKQTREQAEAELAHVGTVDPKYPGRCYNHDPACFARYCGMQARSAKASGHDDIADAIAAIGAQTGAAV